MRYTVRMSVTVYVARIPFRDRGIVCPARRDEIESCSNATVREQKISVWELLTFALRAQGFSPETMEFRCKNGKWGADFVEFSLSHCDGLVAVAVGDTPVGVDIERNARCTPKLVRVMSQTERTRFLSLEEEDKTDFLANIWTRKEASFKRGGNFFAETQTPEFCSRKVGDATVSVTPPATFVGLGVEIEP